MGKNLFVCLLVFCVSTLSALELERQGEKILVSTQRMTVTVWRGRIIELFGLSDGNRIAMANLSEPSTTAGLGCMLGKVKELSRMHFPWGETLLKQHIEDMSTSLYHSPNEQSELLVQEKSDSFMLTWQGLACGDAFFPDESLSLHIQQDKNGAMMISAYGRAGGRGGVFGVQVPIENISNEAKFILPTFGGLEYSGKGKRALMTFADTTLFYEAPLMTLELNGSSLALWKEDRHMRPFYAFFARNQRSCSFALESINLIPYETCTEIQAPALKLDYFAGMDWLGAARPYRDWYHAEFAEDMQKRDSIPWANQINVICDSGSYNDDNLQNIAALMPHERVLFHVWQARKEGFTTNIPDYTPKEAYPGDVARIHRHGFKVMAYTCTLCAVYESPAWVRDKVGEFFLTRKNSIGRYNGGEETISENLMGTINYDSGADQFKGMKKGKFLYGDPLSKGWRDYYCRIIKEFNDITGTDANYQDTSGCSADTGNGIIDGLAGAEGNIEMIRDLQRAMPGIPMAAEFGPQAIGMGIKWPLNYAQVWGGEDFRRYRIHRHRPLTPFIFGYRSWMPTINANDDFHKHLVSACSDALSGMGMFSAGQLSTDAGFSAHMTLRAQQFAKNKLRPYYPEKRYPKNIIAMYQNDEGQIFQYYDDGKLQKMLSPQGKALYGRIDLSDQVADPDLYLPGWPIQDKFGAYNLDPRKNYALFPKKEQEPLAVSIKPLQSGISLKRYYTNEDFAYIEFDAETGIEIKAELLFDPSNYVSAYVNDRKTVLGSPLQVSGQSPLRVLLSAGKDTRPEWIRKISLDDGLQHGKPEPLPTIRRSMAGQTMYFVNYFQAKSLDYLLTVPEEDCALEFCLANTQAKYGNGSIVRILVNGKVLRSFDCLIDNPEWNEKNKEVPKKIFDQKMRKWLLPMNEYAGNQVLVTVQVDSKAESNADSQWISLPRLLPLRLSEIQENFLDPSDNTPVPFARPVGKVLETIQPSFSNSQFEAAGDAYVYICQHNHGLYRFPEKHSFDRKLKYVLSGEFKSSEEKAGTFYLGVMQYDSKGRVIHSLNINRQADSFTRLSHSAAAGSDRIMILDASKWSLGSNIVINPQTDNSDLPRFDLSAQIRELKQHGGDWSAYLEKPLEQSIASDTQVCLHKADSTHSYVSVAKAPQKFIRFGGEVKWWPGAEKYSILLISQNTLEIRNLKLEIMAD